MTSYMVNGQEFYHHGIKGMKWGKRRYQNKDGSLTPAGVKRYAQKGYAQDSYNSNKTVVGKSWDKLTGAHKYDASIRYDLSSKKQNKARAEKYLADEAIRKENKKKMNEELKQLKDDYKFSSSAVESAKTAVALKAGALGVAVVGSAATNSLAKRGKQQAAEQVYRMSRKTFDNMNFAGSVNVGMAVVNGMIGGDNVTSYMKAEKEIRSKYKN